jgi:NTP pyrophosphatase (non-canonical NTP hydrolase)
MKTLAMIKMEKNFKAVIEKGYPRQPYDVYPLQFLLERLYVEAIELAQAIKNKDKENAKLECADVSNIIDYIFEALQK